MSTGPNVQSALTEATGKLLSVQQTAKDLAAKLAAQRAEQAATQGSGATNTTGGSQSAG